MSLSTPALGAGSSTDAERIESTQMMDAHGRFRAFMGHSIPLFSDHLPVGGGKADRQHSIFGPDVLGVVMNTGRNAHGVSYLHLRGLISHGMENASFEHMQYLVAVGMKMPRIRLSRLDHGLTGRHRVGILELSGNVPSKMPPRIFNDLVVHRPHDYGILNRPPRAAG